MNLNLRWGRRARYPQQVVPPTLQLKLRMFICMMVTSHFPQQLLRHTV